MYSVRDYTFLFYYYHRSDERADMKEKNTDSLAKRVIDTRRKRARRMKLNYHLARAYGYTAEESSIIMNQGFRSIMDNAETDGRKYNKDYKLALPEDYQIYQEAIYYRKYVQDNQAKDVTKIGDYI